VRDPARAADRSHRNWSLRPIGSAARSGCHENASGPGASHPGVFPVEGEDVTGAKGDLRQEEVGLFGHIAGRMKW
jgi:hypothetical protein